MKGSYGLDEELATKGVKSLPDLMEDGVAQFYMAKLERDWVGFVVVCWGFSTTSGKPILRIQDIYVEPEFRNRGIGTGLLAFCEKLAKRKARAASGWRRMRTTGRQESCTRRPVLWNFRKGWSA
jgi:GNAT superfamily N-acetyltransferase